MIRVFLTAVILTLTSLSGTMAQQSGGAQELVWIQIEAQPNLAKVNEALRRRSSELQDVNGFDLNGTGWLVVALGPYEEADANRILSRLRREGRIPRDSYITRSEDYLRQIWPVGANLLTARTPAADPLASDETALLEPETPAQLVEAQPEEDSASEFEQIEPEPIPEPEAADETPREARASEGLLSWDERAELQVALEWAGHYAGRIDAAFGAGTRNSMAEWQGANDYEVTGILTTEQRAALLGQYNAVLEGLDMQVVSDPKVGIEMQVPLGVVKFAKYEPPFAHFDATGDVPARVLMISQEGTQDTLYGLYDIMQTLKIVPQDGPRERGKSSFTLTGENETIVSHTEARLENGQIKGFTLIWPANDEERRTRVLGLMQDSFTSIDGVLDPAEGYGDAQSIDLLAGLEIRKPLFSRSGFYVDGSGTVVTTAEFVDACGHVMIEDGQEAEIIASDADSGVAVLRPRAALAPIAHADLSSAAPRLQSEVTVAGYSYGGVLGAPSLTHGKVSDIRGLDGQQNVSRLALNALEGDAGGPVLDVNGTVLGMLLPRKQGGRTLPDDVAFAVHSSALMRVLSQAGATPDSVTPASSSGSALSPALMSARASGMTVLVSCWE